MRSISIAALGVAFLPAILFAAPPDARVAAAKAAYRQAYAARPQARPTATALVRIQPGASIEVALAGSGLRLVGPSRGIRDGWIVRGSRPDLVTRALARLRSRDEVTLAHQARIVPIVRRQESEPFFGPSVGYEGQWYLRNSIGTIDAGFRGAWDIGRRGRGVTVGVIDDGIDYSHPDLAGAIDFRKSFDFVEDDADPFPLPQNFHGTAMAGLIAARVDGYGMTGGAPETAIANLRALGTTDLAIADAAGYLGDLVPVGIDIKLHAYGSPDFFPDLALVVRAFATNNFNGALDIVAAGNEADNGGTTNADTGKDPLANAPGAIVVGAIGYDGNVTPYSNSGCNLHVVAPGDAVVDGRTIGVLTTDNLGDAGAATAADPDPIGGTDHFRLAESRGTSTAAALTAAAIANARGANANLNDRLLRHLLARTARPLPNEAVVRNAAGFRWNERSGFGLLDAGALALAAERTRGVTQLRSAASGTIRVDSSIPDDGSRMTRAVTLPDVGPLEDVRISLRATHPYRGDLTAHLVSPSGTRVRLFREAAADAATDLNATFSTPAFWGEASAGVWVLEVRDTVGGDAGALNSFSLSTTGGQPVITEFNDSTLLSQPDPLRIEPGASFTVPLAFRNTGTRPWTIRDSYRVVATGSDAPRFTDRPTAIPSGPVLAGGAIGINVPAIAPLRPGAYRLVYRMSEGILGFGATTSIDIRVPALYDSVNVSPARSITMSVGQTRNIEWTVRNVGFRAWGRGRRGPATAVRLMAIGGTGLPGLTGIALPTSANVPVFGEWTFRGKFVARTPGTYTVRMRPDRGARGTEFGAETEPLEVVVR